MSFRCFVPSGEFRDLPPGLLVRPTGATVGPTTAQRTGRYSTLITLVPTSVGGRNYEASIVVFETRKLTINEPGTVVSPSDVFQFGTLHSHAMGRPDQDRQRHDLR